MKRIGLAIIILFSCFGMLLAANSSSSSRVYTKNAHKNEIRVGWGDYLFESLVYADTRQKGDYQYTGHAFAEYLYHANTWFSCGLQLDYTQVMWKVKRDEMGNLLENKTTSYYTNIALLYSMRFIYYHHSVVSLYSGLSMGININTGTETNYKGQHTAPAFAFGITALGVRVGSDRVYGAFEFGGLNSLNNMHEIYMLGSRMFSASIGVCF